MCCIFLEEGFTSQVTGRVKDQQKEQETDKRLVRGVTDPSLKDGM